MMKKKNHGQTMVEFAVTIPILLLIVLGTFEIARAIWVYSAVTTAAREAGRYGSAVGEGEGGTPHYIDCAQIRSLAKLFGAAGSVQDADVLITYDSGPGTTVEGPCPISQASVKVGDRIIVEVTGRFTPAAYLPLFQIPAITFTSQVHRTMLKALNLSSIPVTSTPIP